MVNSDFIAIAIPGVYVSPEEPRSRRRVETIRKVAILHPNERRNSYNPHIYNLIRFSDGSDRWMCGHGGWNFIPEEYKRAAYAAICEGCEPAIVD